MSQASLTARMSSFGVGGRCAVRVVMWKGDLLGGKSMTWKVMSLKDHILWYQRQLRQMASILWRRMDLGDGASSVASGRGVGGRILRESGCVGLPAFVMWMCRSIVRMGVLSFVESPLKLKTWMRALGWGLDPFLFSGFI